MSAPPGAYDASYTLSMKRAAGARMVVHARCGIGIPDVQGESPGVVEVAGPVSRADS